MKRSGKPFLFLTILLCVALLPLGALGLQLNPNLNLKPVQEVVKVQPITPERLAEPARELPGGGIRDVVRDATLRESLKVRAEFKEGLITEEAMERLREHLGNIVLMPQPTGDVYDALVEAPAGAMVAVYKSFLLKGDVMGYLSDNQEVRVEAYTMGVAKIKGGAAGMVGGYVDINRLHDMRDGPGDDYDPGCEIPEPEGELYMAVINSTGDLGNGKVNTWLSLDVEGKPWDQLEVGESVVAQNYSYTNAVEIWHWNGLHAFVPSSYLDAGGPYEDPGP